MIGYKKKKKGIAKLVLTINKCTLNIHSALYWEQGAATKELSGLTHIIKELTGHLKGQNGKCWLWRTGRFQRLGLGVL
jgi:hypothetical protein